MLRRDLGRTGLKVSPLGFGAFKIGRNEKVKYPRPYDLPDETTVGNLLNRLLDLGINLIDTAPAYGLSEERIGRHLRNRRSEFILCTKVGETFDAGESRYDFTTISIEQSIYRSLKRLQTDVLDVVLIHAPGNDLEILRSTSVVQTLQRMKSAGHIKAIGLSGKTVEAGLSALDWADIVMVEYHLQDTSQLALMTQATSRGLGVFVKKGLAAGHLPAADAIPFVLNTPGVSSLVLGGLSLEHFAANIAYANNAVDRTL